ncbi:LIM domain transcription factor LMO4-like [Limulus polyphemus]|uniref:LIM domain transcription factor LMO4-like n=1 Tax=Limulus polyphemus TaxID=6850 RepID=A0ABM1T1R0_LIMPO|nr:LIM domain transcription factor LMO4-like [Limulus polyphemus]
MIASLFVKGDQSSVVESPLRENTKEKWNVDFIIIEAGLIQQPRNEFWGTKSGSWSINDRNDESSHSPWRRRGAYGQDAVTPSSSTSWGSSPHRQLPTSGTTGGRSCAGCGGKILDRFLLHALDRYWHNGCLKCSCCQATLGDIGSSCFTKAGMILCKNDYIRMFGNSGACSACGQVIPANEFVMKTQGNVYHLKCFACVKCHNQLNPGDRYNILNGSVLCEQDCLKILKGGTGTTRKGKVRANSAIKAV